MAVVFPAPFGPRKPRISPGSRLNVSGCRAVYLPNCFEMAENVRRGGMVESGLNRLREKSTCEDRKK
jgi:hypothetical protein